MNRNVILDLRCILKSALFVFCAIVYSSFAHSDTIDIDSTKIIDFSESGVSIKLEKFDEPILIHDGHFKSDELGWSKAYDALRNFRRGWVYEDWITYFSDEYIERYSINEDVFNIAMSEPETDLSNTPVRSVLYQLKIRVGDRYFSINQLYNEKLDKLPRSFDSLPYFTATQCFEKVDGKWKVQLVDELGPLSKLPFSDIKKIEKIVELKYAYENVPGVLDASLPGE